MLERIIFVAFIGGVLFTSAIVLAGVGLALMWYKEIYVIYKEEDYNEPT